MKKKEKCNLLPYFSVLIGSDFIWELTVRRNVFCDALFTLTLPLIFEAATTLPEMNSKLAFGTKYVVVAQIEY